MLSDKQVLDIKEHIERAQNPIFFFDNDPDGLCSFLILSRFMEKGKGVAVKSFPELSENYFRKVQELNSDYIFILDKPVVSLEFLELSRQNNIPVVWIDHHDISTNFEIPDFVNYFNPLQTMKTNEPTTLLCYQITKNKKDLWLAVVGSISDSFFPDFYKDFLKEYPDLGIKTNDAFDVFYKSEIGKIARIFSFALKDRTTNVVSMIKFLLDVKSPYEVLEENSKNYSMHRRFKQIEVRYQKLIEKAKSLKDDTRVLFFQYGGDLSISSDISNELIYSFPNKVIVVVYITGAKANISIRGKGVREIILDILKDFENASGGGHEDAVGAKIQVEDLEKFRDLIEKRIG